MSCSLRRRADDVTAKQHLRDNPIAAAVRLLPWLVGVFSGLLLACILLNDPNLPVSRMKDVLPAVASLAAVFVGFAGTAKSILLAMSDGAVITNLKKQDGYRYVVAHFFDTAVLGLVTASASVVALALDWQHCSNLERVFAAIVAGCTLGTILSVAQTTYYLRLLLLQPA